MDKEIASFKDIHKIKRKFKVDNYNYSSIIISRNINSKVYYDSLNGSDWDEDHPKRQLNKHDGPCLEYKT